MHSRQQDCSILCAPDLSLIHSALTGERNYNLVAIIACRLQHNANSGYFYGGIYATCLARGLGVSPLPFDPILPTGYLDFDTLKEHKILAGRADNFTYNLLFNQSHVVDTFLPAPALFDCHSKGRYFVLESEARAHNATVEVAQQAEASTLRASVSYHANYYPGY